MGQPHSLSPLASLDIPLARTSWCPLSHTQVEQGQLTQRERSADSVSRPVLGGAMDTAIIRQLQAWPLGSPQPRGGNGPGWSGLGWEKSRQMMGLCWG